MEKKISATKKEIRKEEQKETPENEKEPTIEQIGQYDEPGDFYMGRCPACSRCQ